MTPSIFDTIMQSEQLKIYSIVITGKELRKFKSSYVSFTGLRGVRITFNDICSLRTRMMIVSTVFNDIIKDLVKHRSAVDLLSYNDINVKSKKLSNGVVLVLIWHEYHYSILSADISDDRVIRVIFMSSLLGIFHDDIVDKVKQFIISLSNVGYKIVATRVTLFAFDQDYYEKGGESNNLCGIFALMFASNLVEQKPLTYRLTVKQAETARVQIFTQMKRKISNCISMNFQSLFTLQST